MKSVLIVEDDDKTRSTMASILRKAGYLTLLAESTRKAIIYLRRSGIDMVILDILMPEMDGLTLLEMIRANPKSADLPVIICSATNDQDKIRKALSLGINGYIKKPFAQETFIQKIEKVWESPDNSNEALNPTSKPEFMKIDDSQTDFQDSHEEKEEIRKSEQDSLQPQVGEETTAASITVVNDKSMPQPKNSLQEIVQNLNNEVVNAGRKLESGEFDDFKGFIEELGTLSENLQDGDLQNYVTEFTDVIESANDARRRYLLTLRSKIQSLKQYIDTISTHASKDE